MNKSEDVDLLIFAPRKPEDVCNIPHALFKAHIVTCVDPENPGLW